MIIIHNFFSSWFSYYELILSLICCLLQCNDINFLLNWNNLHRSVSNRSINTLRKKKKNSGVPHRLPKDGVHELKTIEKKRIKAERLISRDDRNDFPTRRVVVLWVIIILLLLLIRGRASRDKGFLQDEINSFEKLLAGWLALIGFLDRDEGFQNSRNFCAEAVDRSYSPDLFVWWDWNLRQKVLRGATGWR